MLDSTLWDFIKTLGSGIGGFVKWFYVDFLPFVILYIGLPMFFLGILLAFAFAGGTLLFMIIFFIFMYYFIKGTIFNSNPFPNKII
jgi:hypothetical protein